MKYSFRWLALFAILFVGFPTLAASPEVLEGLNKIRFDPPPEALTQNRTYYASDEAELYLFKEAVKPRKGVYMGLGSDPNYVFAAWAEADLIILMDFDQNIVDLHRVYGAFFAAADTPEKFLDLWRKDSEASAHAAIDAFHEKRTKWLKRIYKTSRPVVLKRLEWVKETFPAHEAPTFLNDATQYARIRNHWLNGTIRPVRGDLTKDKTMRDIASFCKKHDLEIRTLYLTNAEYYFPFETGEYISNISNLPMPEDSVVLHTFPRSKTEYRQVFESGLVYRNYVKSKKYKDLRELIRRRGKQVREDVFLFEIR